jgi:hypothetical protein
MPEMVWRRRSTVTGIQYTELVGVDWKPPASIGLTRRRIKPWRSFRASLGSSGCPLATAPEHDWG